METYLLIANLVLLIGLGIGVFYILRHKRKPEDKGDANALLNQINDLRRDLKQTTKEQRSEMSEQLDKIQKRMIAQTKDYSKNVEKMTKQLTELKGTSEQVLDFSKQLQSLEKILKNPKQRGILGEYWLETLLGQVLPPDNYEMEYQLGKDEEGAGLRPDAVLFVRDKKIPIDAKFSLDNYNKITQESDPDKRETLEKKFKRDIKNRIDETAKYVQPDALGTTNFAFMFIPAEGVYHGLLANRVGATKINSRNLIEYAFEKNVLIVSPTPFFAYLQTVLLGLKALQIEEDAEMIQKQAGKLMNHLRKYEQDHNKIGKHLQTTMRAYNRSSKEFKKIDKDVYRLTEGDAGRELEPGKVDPDKADVD
jgi:DNA recombination protein RmuC